MNLIEPRIVHLDLNSSGFAYMTLADLIAETLDFINPILRPNHFL